MSTENKTQPTQSSVSDFVAALGDAQRERDCRQLIEIMQATSGCEPVMWGPGIIGFDTYHYVYDSGREGDAPAIAFSPRKDKLVVYVDEVVMASDLFDRLGKHTTSKVCIYIKRLSDVDVSVLAQIIDQSYHLTKHKEQ